MSSAAYVGLLLGCLLTRVDIYCNAATTLAAVGPEVPPPWDLNMITLNTNYTLRWDWDQSLAESHAVTFTTQYIGMYQLESKKTNPNWSTACEETSHRSCDLTTLGLHYLGMYVLRVQANANGHHSKWVKLNFCPDKDAAVGPPANVTLGPAGSDLDVFISDPMSSSNISMREHISGMYYHILYWELSDDSKALRNKSLNSEATVVTLPDLTAWTWYCVSVQSRSDFYNKKSSFTSPHCMQTEGNTPWWQISLYFVGSLMVCFLFMLLLLYCSFRCCKTIKATFFPSNQLPTHFKEYLFDSPGSDIPRLHSPVSESELLCDNVIICEELAVLEIHNFYPDDMTAPPRDLEADTSGGHIRQGSSSSSGDSGVYSTGGSSNLPQLNNSQSSTGTEDVEQVKLLHMTPGLESKLLTADEGIEDMCV